MRELRKHEHKISDELVAATPPGDKHLYLFFQMDGELAVLRLGHDEVKAIAALLPEEV